MKKTLTEQVSKPSSLKFLWAAFLIILFFPTVHSQPDIEWSKGYGGTLNDIPFAMQKTPDGGYIIAGQSASLDGEVSINYGGFDVWVTKLDADGNLDWSKNYGGSKDDFAMDIQLTSDGGYVISGGSFSYDGDVGGNYGKGDIWILKINVNGLLEWSNYFGGAGADIATTIQETNDGGYIVAGCTGSAGEPGLAAGAGSNDFWVLKLNTDGTLNWQKTYGGARHDAAKSILQTADGGFLIGGNTWSKDGDIIENNGQSDAWILKTDAAGVIEWSKTFGSITTDRLSDIVESPDGNFVFTGTFAVFDTTGFGFGGRYDENFWILKFDPNGNEIWSKTYGSSKYDEATCLRTTLDGGYLVGGYVQAADEEVTDHFGHKDFWMIRTDTVGEIVWSKTLGGAQNEVVQAIEETNDGGYLLAGFSNSVFVDTLLEVLGYEDWWVVKLESTAITVDLGDDLTLCENETFTLDVENPNCVCNYLWNDGDTTPTRTFALLEDTQFSVTVTDALGFSLADEILITISTPTAVLEPTPISCDGDADGMIDLIPDGNYTYLWNNNATTEDLNNLLPGAYTATITDAFECTFVQSATITAPPAISISQTINHIDCFGESTGNINVNGTGGTGNLDYFWNTGITLSELNNIPAGTYTVTITDENFCQTTATFEVQQNPIIQLSATPQDVNCFGENNGSINLTPEGGVGTFSYQWSESSTSQDIYNLAIGTYSVTVTDGLGCKKTNNWVVNQPLEISINTVPHPALCFDSADGEVTTSANGGVGNFTYQWSNGMTNSTLSNVPSGTYTLTVTDENFCQKITMTEVVAPDKILIESDVLQASCIGNNDGSITTQISGGTGSYSFAWSNGETTPNLSNLSGGTYTLTITDVNLCEKIKEIAVSQNTGIEVAEQITENLCYGNSNGAIDLTVSGGTENFTFLWSNGETTEDLDQLPANDYIVTISDGGGCEEIQLFTVSQPDEIDITFTTSNPSCFDSLDGSIELLVTGGTGDFTYLWNGTGINTMTSVPILDSLPGGTYHVITEDENGCLEFIQNIQIEAPSPILISNIQVQNTSCHNSGDGSINFTVEGGTPPYSYAWFPNPNFPGEIYAGDYYVEITDANGCEFTSPTYTVSSPLPLEVNPQMTNPTSGNNDGSITALVSGGTPGYEFLWSDGQTTPQAINLVAGTYTVTITDQNGCQIITSILLETTDIFEIENLEVFEISPNPNNGDFFLTIHFQNQENAEISIMDELGQPIYEFRKQNVIILEEIKLPKIVAGIYFVRVKTEEGITVRKMIVMK